MAMITSKQLNTGIEIMRMIFESKGIKSPRVNDVIDQAKIVAVAMVKDSQDHTAFANAIVAKMVTVKVEAH